jgi:hypothetical protein
MSGRSPNFFCNAKGGSRPNQVATVVVQYGRFGRRLCMQQPIKRPRGPLLDHLVSGGQQRFGDGKAERLGGHGVENQLDFRGLLDR